LPVAIHAWLDGRDTPPKSALGFMENLLEAVRPLDERTAVSTVIGRYYAMDRDKRWERTKLAYDAMVKGIGVPAPDPLTAIKQAYAAGETDEFVKPRVIDRKSVVRERVKREGGGACQEKTEKRRHVVKAARE